MNLPPEAVRVLLEDAALNYEEFVHQVLNALDAVGHPTECILQDHLDVVRFQKKGSTITVQN